jgi:DNA (cytosine-5)-methyltransferase 1
VAAHPVNLLSVCSGGAGLDVGVMLAEPRARVVGFVEREAFAATVLVARMEDEALCPAPVWDDVAGFDGRPWRGVVDCITAGFPCQPWSVAGHRRGKADERWIWPEIARIVREVGPAVVFLENVPGLVGEGLASVLGDLAGLGFDAEWGVLGANEVGAPHRRRRLFILAHADLGRWRAPAGGRGGEGTDGDAEAPGGAGVGGGVLADPVRDRPAPHRDESAAAVPADARLPCQRRWRAGLELWPPGPDDTTGWRRVLTKAPQLAPATQPLVRGVADGVAAELVESIRGPRLHLLGNGVVPLAAALAWQILLNRALARETG